MPRGAFTRDGFTFSWPIWRDPLGLSGIRALLLHPALQRATEGLAHLGVVEVRRTQRISVGKFVNFTRAIAILLTSSPETA